MRSQMAAAAPTEAGQETMPKRGMHRQRVRLTANSRTGSKREAYHSDVTRGRRTESGWPAKCITWSGTGRRVLEQEKQVTNWMNSGGHVPRPCIGNSNRETTGRHRAGRWKKWMMIGSLSVMLPLAADRGEARDPD